MKRKISESLARWKRSKSRKPLVLRGARQVGKTYSLTEFGKTAFQRFHYANFENNDELCALFERNLSPSRIIDELQFHFDRIIDITHDLVIFDEIQQCPRALTSLKYFCEELPELALCSAGSLLGLGLAGHSFPVGKVNFLDMYPMSFEEFLAAIEETRLVELVKTHDFRAQLPEMAHNQLWDIWKLYLVVGGLPEAVKTYCKQSENRYKAVQAVRRVHRDLLDAYMNDIAKHSGKTNAMHIERLWRNVPVQLARSQDGSASKFTFKDALPGVRGYERLASPLGWLENTRLIIRTSIVKRAETPLIGFSKENRFKQYFFDVGLLGASGDIDPNTILNYEYGNYKGFVAENFVAQELRAIDVRNLFCWEGRTSEVEFLLETASGIIPLEVKSGRATRSKSLDVFEERYNPKRSFVLSAKNVEKRGIRLYLPIYAAGQILRILEI